VEAQKDITAVCLKSIMEGVISLSVPLIAEVGIGANWSEAKK
jgi:DNA polymerase I-like protein with 3'-5' exonuclease and polymerase domains